MTENSFYVWHFQNGMLYARTKLGNIKNLLPKRWVFDPNCKKFTWKFSTKSFSSGTTVTVNGERYHAMLHEFLFPNIEENDMDDLPHSQRNNRTFGRRFRKPNNQSKFWCQLATSELWFEPDGLIIQRQVRPWNTK